MGIAHLLVMALEKEGVSKAEATRKIWMVDSKGLIVKVLPRDPWGFPDTYSSHKMDWTKAPRGKPFRQSREKAGIGLTPKAQIQPKITNCS